MTRTTFCWGLIVAIVPVLAVAQTPVVKSLAPVKETVTIQAIDSTTRMITIRDATGDEDILYAPPEIKRFSELKVGQRVNMSYYESLVLRLAKPGTPAQSLSTKDAVTPGTGVLPGGTVARQMTATVDVVAVDQVVPSITIKTKDGRTITRKVDDAKNLAGVKAGDQIDITYTQAALVNVEPGN